MTNQLLTKITGFSLLLLVTMTACKKEDDPKPVNEGEELTTVELTLTPTGNNPTPIVITYRDRDGEGGNPPVLTPTTLSLAASTVYNARLRFLNENATPVVDVTKEIEDKESDEHEVFYTASNGLNLTVTNRNRDVNGKPLGTTATITTGAAATGTLTVTLKHKERDKNPPKTDNDPITKGETDVEVPFLVTIQ